MKLRASLMLRISSIIRVDPKAQKKIDEIMYETNEKINAIVNEIRDIRFSKMDENEKETKCDDMRLAFEQVMIEEERKVEKVMKECP